MNHKDLRVAVVLLLVLLLAELPVLGAPAAVGKVLPRQGTSAVNNTTLQAETTLFAGDTLTTQGDSLAMIELAQGDQVNLGPLSSASLTTSDQEVFVNLASGSLMTRNGGARHIVTSAQGLVVSPSGPALYEVAIQGGSVLVSSHAGSVEVQGTNQSVIVPEGKAMKFQVASVAPSAGVAGAGANNMGPGAAAGIAIAVSLGASFGIVLPLAYNRANDRAEEACREAIRALSSTAPTTGCSF